MKITEPLTLSDNISVSPVVYTNTEEHRFIKHRIRVHPRSSAVNIYSLCIKMIIALILLVSTAYAVEYSADVVAGAAALSVGIDCPSEVQKKSEFTVNATITNPGEENAADVIAELIAPKKAFSYGQPKKRIGEIEGNTLTIVSWNVTAKRPGNYNITVIATGKAETAEEELFAQDKKAIVVSSSASVGTMQGFYDYVYRLFRGGWRW